MSIFIRVEKWKLHKSQNILIIDLDSHKTSLFSRERFPRRLDLSDLSRVKYLKRRLKILENRNSIVRATGKQDMKGGGL